MKGEIATTPSASRNDKINMLAMTGRASCKKDEGILHSVQNDQGKALKNDRGRGSRMTRKRRSRMTERRGRLPQHCVLRNDERKEDCH